jgi:protocatechuate 3,4-dioxygenase beta subunit
MISSPRRRFLIAAAALPLVPGIALAQTCGKQTAPQTPGPFFKPDSPVKSVLFEKGQKSVLLVVSGTVLSAQCRPVANALLDFWHADEFGEYDNKGFRFRGHQFTDAQGRWRLETILPGEYPGRARHIHAKVQAPGKRILTTQLYFPAALGHHNDGLYKPGLEMRMPKAGEGSFDFVVDA